MAKLLTAAAAARARPRPIRFEVRDGGAPGLYLGIAPSGHRSWVCRFRRPGGRPAKVTLGPLDLSGRRTEDRPEIGQPLTLAEARVLASEVYRQRASGRDPAAERKEERRRAAEGRGEGFGAAARQFIAEYARPRNRGWRETARALAGC